MQTHFVGWADEKHHQELREASLVDPDITTKNWRKYDIPYIVVHTREEYKLFRLVGGYALVEKRLAEDVASHIIRPSPKVRVGSVGFTSLDGLSPSAFKPSPSPKLRMRILKRDGYRCRICGRKPDDYLDLELHVHHIRKRANGGLTEEANLITLCNTCHRGLDPHEDFTLFDYIEEQNLTVESLIESIRNYRKLYFGSYSDLIQDSDKIDK